MGTNRRRWIVRALVMLLLGAIGLAGWLAVSMFEQLNNSIAVQSCARRIQRGLARTGVLPANVECLDYLGAKLWYGASGRRFVLVSFGRDGVQDMDSHARSSRLMDEGPVSALKRRNCFSPNVDTVFVGAEPIQFCLK
jgi:hypothetical protein